MGNESVWLQRQVPTSLCCFSWLAPCLPVPIWYPANIRQPRAPDNLPWPMEALWHETWVSRNDLGIGMSQNPGVFFCFAPFFCWEMMVNIDVHPPKDSIFFRFWVVLSRSQTFPLFLCWAYNPINLTKTKQWSEHLKPPTAKGLARRRKTEANRPELRPGRPVNSANWQCVKTLYPWWTSK